MQGDELGNRVEAHERSGPSGHWTESHRSYWRCDTEELLEQPGAGKQTTKGPPSANPTGVQHRSAIRLSPAKQGLPDKGGAGGVAGMALGSDQVAWVPVVIECHVALAVVSKPPFYPALLCCSSLRFRASTSGEHGLVVLGAWSYHVVRRCHCSGRAPLADHHGVPWAGPAHRWQLLACLKSPLADHHGARSANPSCWKGWPLSCGFSCDLAMDDRLLKEWQYGYGFGGAVD